MEQVIITLLTHKSRPEIIEEISIMQYAKVLKQHKLALVIPENIDDSYYKKLFAQLDINYTIERFSNMFFGTIDNYNRFMLSEAFYRRFISYKYILIYHFDCFIFRDELEKWCSLDYDYIGAPWFEQCDAHNNSIKTIGVGNGGLSLRKTSTFLNILSRKHIKLTIASLYKSYMTNIPLTDKFIRFPKFILKTFGIRNNKQYYQTKPYTEDLFWGNIATNIKDPVKVCSIEEAMRFSFDGNPYTLFKMNEHKLPFGCHGWYKYNTQTFEFWKPFIEKEGYSLHGISFKY